jgi:hypothetical protein
MLDSCSTNRSLPFCATIITCIRLRFVNSAPFFHDVTTGWSRDDLIILRLRGTEVLEKFDMRLKHFVDTATAV